MLVYGFLGLFLILLSSFIRRTKDKYRDVCIAVAIPITLILLKPFGLISGHLRPVTLDGPLRDVDLFLHLDGFALTRLCMAHGWMIDVLKFVYEALPLALAIAWVADKSDTLMRACVIGVLLAFPLYMLVPAVGPAFTFTNWPFDGGQIIQPAAMYPRNCFPSMHFAWAFLLALNTSGRLRWVFGVYAALMAVSTVVSGQHYFVDVAVAIPFTVAVQQIAVASARQVVLDGLPVAGQPEL
jgi:membrane-associated phospholipid phosphatase